jgi:hypothetical protein
MLYLLWSVAYAGYPIAVVGAHLPGFVDKEAEEVSEALADALRAERQEVWEPGEVSEHLSGKESLVLEDFALGPGRELMQEARILYERAQPDVAIPVADEAVKALELSQGLGRSQRDLQDALLLLGMCYLADGNDAQAIVQFERAAGKDPDRDLETASYPPQVRELFAASVKKLKSMSPGQLWVNASAEATIIVDGRSAGTTPVEELILVPGNHVVVAQGPEGSSASSIVTIVSGQPARLDMTLERRNLGRVDALETGRSRQTRHLYQALGRYSGAELVLLAGKVGADIVLQWFDPQTSTFSKIHTAPAGSSPSETLIAELGEAMEFLDGKGGIQANKSGTKVAALEVASNDVLAGLLLDPSVETVDNGGDRKKLPWYLWAGIGAVVAGGGIAGGVIAATAPSGYVTFGPLP